MLKTLGVVEVYTGSGIPNHSRGCLSARRFGDQSLLEWVTRRMTDALLLEHVVVIASGDEYARQISRRVPSDVSVFAASDSPDPVGRFAAALRAFEADAAVRVTLDNPFVDPVLIDRLVESRIVPLLRLYELLFGPWETSPVGQNWRFGGVVQSVRRASSGRAGIHFGRAIGRLSFPALPPRAVPTAARSGSHPFGPGRRPLAAGGRGRLGPCPDDLGSARSRKP